MPPGNQHGGREYGAGVAGRTINTVKNPSMPINANNNTSDDTETLHHKLSEVMVNSQTVGSMFLYVLESGKIKRMHVKQNIDKDKFKTLISTPKMYAFVSKLYSTRENFIVELNVIGDVMKAIPENEGLSTATTLSTIPFQMSDKTRHKVVGFEIAKHDIFCTFSLRCTVPVSNIRFDSDTLLDKFVVETLQNFKIIHDHGLSHGDVKVDNIIYCADEDRFKLIDWGKSIFETKLPQRYLIPKPVLITNNTSSPVAWLTFGLNYSWSYVFTTMVLSRHVKDIIMCPRMTMLVTHVYKSFERMLNSYMGHTTFGRAISIGRMLSKRFRRQMLDMYWRSFDLFDLGFIVTMIVCKYGDSFSQKMKDRVAEFSRRIMSYGDDDFAGKSADEALSVWNHTTTTTKTTKTKINAGSKNRKTSSYSS